MTEKPNHVPTWDEIRVSNHQETLDMLHRLFEIANDGFEKSAYWRHYKLREWYHEPYWDKMRRRDSIYINATLSVNHPNVPFAVQGETLCDQFVEQIELDHAEQDRADEEYFRRMEEREEVDDTRYGANYDDY